ncbi:hypothetical protein DFJ74DRAFT_676225 [Hyaloraphidium curvatum]|nr:hypothetical protein DFJ74DRAFT_676225 [Hyaloraphidium curvatum]
MSLLQNLGDGRRFAHTRSIKAPWQAPPASMFDLLPLCTNLERLSLSALEIDELSVLARSCPSLVNVSVDVMCVRTGHIPDWGSLEPLPRREWALSVWYRLENEKSIPDGFDCDEAEAVLRGMIRWMPGLKSIDLAVPFTFYQEPSGDGFWNSAAPLLKRLTFIDHTVLEKLATTPGDPLSLMRPLELRIHQAVPATVAALQKLGQPPTKLSFIHSPMDYLLPLFGESPIEVSELFLFDCFFQGGIFGQIGADALRTMLDRSRIGSIVVFCNTLLAAPEKDVELWREVCGEAVVSNRGGKVEQTFTYRPRKSG